MPWLRRPFFFTLIILTLVLSGCNYADLGSLHAMMVATPAATSASLPSPAQLVPKIISKRPHDTTSFTEGLFLYNGFVYESSGLYGKSNLRKEDPKTGKVLQQVRLPDSVFGEGIALNGTHLVQLTWHENTAYIDDVNTFAQVGTFKYDGEGWGLCYDGKDFYMTNGSANITTRDSTTFADIHESQVVLKGMPIMNLNELECVGDSLYVNVWMSNMILRLDKLTGRVTGVIDASGLLTPQETTTAGSDGVLNGIAYDPTHDTFLITGKLWPWMFEVQFVPKP